MEKSLYERLGSTDGIKRIVDDVMAAHLRNPAIETRFEAIEDFAHVTKMAVEFFVAGSGGPDPYTGHAQKRHVRQRKTWASLVQSNAEN